MSDPTSLTIAAARKSLGKGEINALELTDAYLAAMERARVSMPMWRKRLNRRGPWRRNPTAGWARAAPARSKAFRSGIKDLFATRGVHTQACSRVSRQVQAYL